MSTRCLISIREEDVRFKSIYCHFDGDDQGVGKALRQYFHTPELAQSLIGLGDVSYISGDDVCAYHRDRGEKWSKTKPRATLNEQELLRLARECDADYLYIFEGQHWSTWALRS